MIGYEYPCQGKNAGQIRILGIQVRPYRAGIAELPLVELHVEIKSDRIRVAAQDAVAHGKDRGRKLNVRPQRVPA